MRFKALGLLAAVLCLLVPPAGATAAPLVVHVATGSGMLASGPTLGITAGHVAGVGGGGSATYDVGCCGGTVRIVLTCVDVAVTASGHRLGANGLGSDGNPYFIGIDDTPSGPDGAAATTASGPLPCGGPIPVPLPGGPNAFAIFI